jgi:hypothetical protein
MESVSVNRNINNIKQFDYDIDMDFVITIDLDCIFDYLTWYDAI